MIIAKDAPIFEKLSPCSHRPGGNAYETPDNMTKYHIFQPSSFYDLQLEKKTVTASWEEADTKSTNQPIPTFFIVPTVPSGNERVG